MFKDLRTQTHLKPGQKGTKRLVEKYGDALICVRYRYDKSRGIRCKTVEIIEEKIELKPSDQYRDGDMVSVVVSFSEKALRDRLKAAGGKWDPEEKLWRVPYGMIRGNSELEERIVPD